MYRQHDFTRDTDAVADYTPREPTRVIGNCELDRGGSQHVAPIVAWLATEGAASGTSGIFHSVRGGVAITQQRLVNKPYKKRAGLWSLDKLDNVCLMRLQPDERI